MIARSDITGVILAGGQATRMGGVDKGLQIYRGQALALRAVERLAPQVGALIINANRNLDTYAAYGHPVVSDAHSGFQGPLAGFMAGLDACTTPWLVTVPCDSPFFPLDLVERLAREADSTQAQAALPVTDGQTQPVFMLMRTELRESLRAYIEGGGRKIMAWYAELKTIDVDFSADADAFVNFNSLQDLAATDSSISRESSASNPRK